MFYSAHVGAKTRVFAILLVVGFLLSMLAMGCGESASEQTPDGDLPDGDSVPDGDLTPDGDADSDEPFYGGSGRCDDPFIANPNLEQVILDGTGDIEDMAAAVSAEVCAEPESAVRPDTRADEDGDADEEEQIDGDTEAATDGDTEATTDSDAEEAEQPAPVAGLGPEVVIKLAMDNGDSLSITFYGDTFDAAIYIRQNLCATGNGCEKVKDAVGVGQLESLSFTASERGNYYVIMDSNEPNATGSYFYHIELVRVGQNGGPGDGQVGGPCETGNDCMTGYCLTGDSLGPLVGADGLDIPGGYCTTIFCHTDGSDGKCTEEMGGECISLYPFYGELFNGRGVCMRLCESDADCRVADNMRCMDPQAIVDMGLLAQSVADEYFGDRKACLPNELIDAGIAALQEEKQ